MLEHIESTTKDDQMIPVFQASGSVARSEDSAYTVYDKVDLLSPGGESGEQGSYQYLGAGEGGSLLPPPPPCLGSLQRGRRREQREEGVRDSGTVSVDSLSSLLSDLRHQESVL